MKAGLSQGLNLVTLDHASVSHERHLFTPKAPRYLRDLRRQGDHIRGIPGKDVHGHGHALFITQQPQDYLFFPSFAVSVITKCRKSVALALEVTARDVIEKQRRLAVAPPSRE
jgi:hypothetical protein